MRCLVIFLTLLFSLHGQAEMDVIIKNAWIKESPPGVEVNAAYMDIHNNSDRESVLIAAQSPDFAAIEIHRTVIEQGKARMQRHTSIAIPAGAVLSLAPGSWHLMLFRPRQAVRHGAAIDLSLQFADGTSTSLTLPVYKYP